MNRLVIIYLTFILCLSLSFALQVTITADFNNTKNVDRLGTLDWFIEPTNGNKTINVTGYCLEEDASKITIPQKQSNGQPGTVRKTCTITDKELLKRYYSFYTYATFSYMQPETIDGSPKIVYYTFPTPKSREFKFDNFIENVLGGATDLWDLILGTKKCDKDPSKCTVGDFCYLTDPATVDLNTVEKMAQHLNNDPALKARVDQAFQLNDEGSVLQNYGCLPKSTKELFDPCSSITDETSCKASENKCLWSNGKCYEDKTLRIKQVDCSYKGYKPDCITTSGCEWVSDGGLPVVGWFATESCKACSKACYDYTDSAVCVNCNCEWSDGTCGEKYLAPVLPAEEEPKIETPPVVIDKPQEPVTDKPLDDSSWKIYEVKDKSRLDGITG